MNETLIKKMVYNYLKATNEEEEQLHKADIEKVLEYRGKKGIYLEVLRTIKKTMQEEIREKVNAYLKQPHYAPIEEYEAEETANLMHYYGFIFYNVIE